jgi:aspartate 1-decarboxylase
MRLTLLKSKLHRATVTGADLDYEGSIAIGPELIRAAGLLPWERVDVYNVTTGARFSTYVIPGRERGEVLVNGAAARLVQKGDHVIVAAYAEFDADEARRHRPIVVLLDAENRPIAAPETVM